jgi:hypothetical protein
MIRKTRAYLVPLSRSPPISEMADSTGPLGIEGAAVAGFGGGGLQLQSAGALERNSQLLANHLVASY